jgi:hypothetical protein
MKKCGMYKLKIDPEFELLIPPLPPSQYEQLEEDIFEHGCTEPILVWNNWIIDGHKRYKICNKWEIPFMIDELEFDSHEDALVWVCQTQLQRPKLSSEYKKYLIGKMYDAEVILGIRNPSEQNSSSETLSRLTKQGEPMNKYKTVKEVCDLTGLTRKHLYYFHHTKVVQAVAYASCAHLLSTFIIKNRTSGQSCTISSNSHT